MSNADSGLSVLFFGRRAELSSRVLRAIAEKHRVVGIVESQAKGYQPPAKWKSLFSRSVREQNIEAFATKHGIPYFRMTKNRMPELATFIQSVKPDIGFIAMMAHLLPEPIIDLFPRGILNVHPSMLPKYRGPSPLFWTYFYEESRAGVTVHYIDRGEDTGDIVRQAEVPMGTNETAPGLIHRCATLAEHLAPAVLSDIAKGTAGRVSQRGLPCLHRARMLKPGEDPIDWQNWPVSRVYGTLRGADGTFDLMPPRPFPWNLFDWSPAGCTPMLVGDSHPQFVRRGLSFVIETAQGLVHLRPRLSGKQFKRGLQSLFSRPRPVSAPPKPPPAMVDRPRAA